MYKKLLCMIASIMIVVGCCTMARGESVEERVERKYPNWKEDWECWENKELVSEERELVCAVVEHESGWRGTIGETSSIDT